MPFLLQIFIIFLSSLLITPLILSGISFLFQKWGFLDRPHLYKSEKWRKPAPYGVGIVLILMLLIFFPVFYFSFDFSAILERRLHIVMILWVLLALVSFVDDMDTIGKSPISVPPLFRLGMQILIGLIIGLTSIKISYVSGLFGWVVDLTDYFISFSIAENIYTIYYIPILLTIFWYALVFNGVNFSDGVPGLTGWYALISFIILAGLAIKLLFTDTSIAAIENSRFLLMILAVVIPTTFWLTRADISRKVIMGDSGTIMLAFLIATLAIIAWGKIATAMAVLGVYLIDLIYVVTVRILQGKNPLKWEQSTHLHFRLMEIGFSKQKIRLTVYFLTAFFGVTAIFLDTKWKIFLFIIIWFITIFLTQILTIVKKK